MDNGNDSDDDSLPFFDINRIVPLVPMEQGDRTDSEDDHGTDSEDEEYREQDEQVQVSTLFTALEERLSALAAEYSTLSSILPDGTSDLPVTVAGVISATAMFLQHVAAHGNHVVTIRCGTMEDHVTWVETGLRNIFRGLHMETVTSPEIETLQRQVEFLDSNRDRREVGHLLSYGILH